MKITPFVDFPDLPTVRTYEEWAVTIRRLVSAVCDKPDDAMVWIEQAFNDKIPMIDLKKGKNSPWQCLDIQLSVQISNKVAAAKKDPNTPPILMQLAQTILTEERIAQSNKRFLTGREMIRHIGTWAAVKCEHGQKYNIADLLRMRLKDTNPDEDLYEFYYKWEDV